MKEKTFVRHLNITFENDGTAHLNGRLETVLLDDAGAIVAVKPETFPVSARLEAGDVFAAAARDAAIKAHIDELERVRAAAEKAATEAAQAAQAARASAEAAKG